MSEGSQTVLGWLLIGAALLAWYGYKRLQEAQWTSELAMHRSEVALHQPRWTATLTAEREALIHSRVFLDELWTNLAERPDANVEWVVEDLLEALTADVQAQRARTAISSVWALGSLCAEMDGLCGRAFGSIYDWPQELNEIRCTALECVKDAVA